MQACLRVGYNHKYSSSNGQKMLRGGDCTAAHNGLANRILELVQARAP